jgi:hypothetical protein
MTAIAAPWYSTVALLSDGGYTSTYRRECGVFVENAIP